MGLHVLSVRPIAPRIDPGVVGTRRVNGIWLGDLFLGSAARAAGVGDNGVLLNPQGAYRSTNPANLGSFAESGHLLWVLPVSFERLSLGGVDARSDELVRTFWQRVDERLSGSHMNPALGWGQIWNPGSRVGALGVEIGAQGNAVHPWVSLLDLPALGAPRTSCWLLCPISDRRFPKERYQAWFGATDLIADGGGPLATKLGPLEPHDGAIELNHFAVLDPVAEQWLPLGAKLSDRAMRSALDEFHDWPQRQSSDDAVRV